MTAPLENNPSPDSFSITYQTKARLPRVPFSFEKMKDAVLGQGYELSVAIVDDALMQKLNLEHRQIDKPTDILSFSLTDVSGEIFLGLDQCKMKAASFDRTYENYLGFVFIHGLLHLKGFDHGSTMEDEEEIIRKKFGI